MKKRGGSLLLFFLFLAAPAYSAEVCGWSVAYEITAYGMDCPSVARPYEFELFSGCAVSYSETANCVSLYKVCCPDTTKSYEDSITLKKTQTAVAVGQEQQIAEGLYEQAKLEIAPPNCSPGYSKTADLLGYASDIKSNPSDYSKSDVTITAWGRIGCSKFTNTTTVSLNPVSSGGGTAVESLVELQKVNTALTTIKTVLDNIPNSTNPLLTDIKTLLQNGLNFNSANLETGINQVSVNTNQIGVNTAAGNDILTAINNKLTQNCTTVWDPNGGSCNTFDHDRNPETPNIITCTGANVTTCEGLDVSDSASLAKLQEIKDAIIAGGGGTVNADLTETNNKITESNGFLSDIKNLFVGSSTLPQYVNNTLARSRFVSETVEDVDLFFASDYKSAFDTFQVSAKNTPIFGLIANFFGGAPTSGNSVVSFNGGRYGEHSYDFANFSVIMFWLKGIILVIFSAVCLRIIILKGGGG